MKDTAEFNSNGDEAPLKSYRLFSAGIHGEIAEWDLVACTKKNSEISSGGAVWACTISTSLWNSTATKHHTKPILAAACEDGTIRLFDVSHADHVTPMPMDRLPKHFSRLVSITFGADSETLFAGSLQGSILKFNLRTKSCDLTFGLPPPPQNTHKLSKHERKSKKSSNNNENGAIIWSLGFFPSPISADEHILFAGDSEGNLIIWNAETGTVAQRLSVVNQSPLVPAVLCLSVVSSDPLRPSLFAGFGDGRLAVFATTKPLLNSNQQVQNMEATPPEWTIVKQTFPHLHGISCITISSNLCLSAAAEGIAALQVNPGGTLASGRPLRLRLSQELKVRIGTDHPFILIPSKDKIEMWHTSFPTSSNDSSALDIFNKTGGATQVLSLALKAASGYIRDAAMSPACNRVALSGRTGGGLFAIDLSEMSVKEISCAPLKRGCVLASHFLDDRRLLVSRMVLPGDKTSFLATAEEIATTSANDRRGAFAIDLIDANTGTVQGRLLQMSIPVKSFATSPCGSLFGTLDASGVCRLFTCDSLMHRLRLPRLPNSSIASLMAFSPNGRRIVLLSSDGQGLVASSQDGSLELPAFTINPSAFSPPPHSVSENREAKSDHTTGGKKSKQNKATGAPNAGSSALLSLSYLSNNQLLATTADRLVQISLPSNVSLPLTYSASSVVPFLLGAVSPTGGCWRGTMSKAVEATKQLLGCVPIGPQLASRTGTAANPLAADAAGSLESNMDDGGVNNGLKRKQGQSETSNQNSTIEAPISVGKKKKRALDNHRQEDAASKVVEQDKVHNPILNAQLSVEQKRKQEELANSEIADLASKSVLLFEFPIQKWLEALPVVNSRRRYGQ